MWAYIFFIFHLRTKEESEFTGQESYVWNKMSELDLTFFPANRAICLQNKGPAGEDIDRRTAAVAVRGGGGGGGGGNAKSDALMESKLAEVWTEQKALAKRGDASDRRMRDVLNLLQNMQGDVQRCLALQEENQPTSARDVASASRGSGLALSRARSGSLRDMGFDANQPTPRLPRLPSATALRARQRSSSLVVPEAVIPSLPL